MLEKFEKLKSTEKDVKSLIELTKEQGEKNLVEIYKSHYQKLESLKTEIREVKLNLEKSSEIKLEQELKEIQNDTEKQLEKVTITAEIKKKISTEIAEMLII